MIVRIFKKNKRKDSLVEPDEIFLDSENVQNFDRQQFEGRIEKSISKRNIFLLTTFFIVAALTFGVRLGYLQIEKGEAYFARAENNTLDKQVLFADRGIIYDRNKVELAWNKKDEDPTPPAVASDFPTRMYLTPGFSHVLGYVSYPMRDKTGNYWQPNFIGKDGLEKEYGAVLQGTNGSKIVETDAHGGIHSENVVDAPKQGADLVTTLDSRLQGQLYDFIQTLSANHQFSGGSGIIMDVTNGQVLTSTSFPEYDSGILSLGKDTPTIKSYLTDDRNVFLDRTISGLYTPGSIVKPFFAMGALTEGVIDQYKKILSTGSISIPNPYYPDQKTVFKDWRANGWTDIKQALAVSSDVYFYEIGGGYQDQPGLGIANIGKYAKEFGIGTQTGIDLPDEAGGTIPSPEWKAANFKGDPWRLGDTYHTAIGQYGFQVTPVEMVRAVSAIANNGKLLTPHLILGDTAKEAPVQTLDFKPEYFDAVREGMRDAVTEGTATSLNVPYVQVAVKTGTAQLGVAKNKVNSWVMGFFPYDHPKYAFVIMMEAGPSTNSVGASSVARELLDWMSVNTPEYFTQQ